MAVSSPLASANSTVRNVMSMVQSGDANRGLRLALYLSFSALVLNLGKLSCLVLSNS